MCWSSSWGGVSRLALELLSVRDKIAGQAYLSRRHALVTDNAATFPRALQSASHSGSSQRSFNSWILGGTLAPCVSPISSEFQLNLSATGGNLWFHEVTGD